MNRGLNPLRSLRGQAPDVLSRALVWMALLALTPAAAATVRFQEGTARDAEGRVLYREHHWTRQRDAAPLERLVVYRCASGAAFARKRVDYRDSMQAPAFMLEDRRSGYREGLRRSDRTVGVFVRESVTSAEASAVLPAAGLVADAGFDAFIQARWAALVAGRAQSLEFAVPARLRSLGFSVRRIGSGTLFGEPAWVFRLRLQGLLGAVAPHIDVSYGQASRRLLRFEGVGNLRDDGGRRQAWVKIDFPAPPRAAPDEAWQQAAGLGLSACGIGQ